MKSFKNVNQGIQGDVAITRITKLPIDAKRADAVDGYFVVAHSETGHHHVVAERHATMYTDFGNPLVGYIEVGDVVDLEHRRAFDTHETVQLDAGVYRVNRQREYTPKGLRRVAD